MLVCLIFRKKVKLLLPESYFDNWADRDHRNIGWHNDNQACGPRRNIMIGILYTYNQKTTKTNNYLNTACRRTFLGGW